MVLNVSQQRQSTMKKRGKKKGQSTCSSDVDATVDAWGNKIGLESVHDLKSIGGFSRGTHQKQ